MEQKSPASSISGVTLSLLISAAFLAALSVLTHTKIHAISHITHHGSMLLGGIALFTILPRWIYAMVLEAFALLGVLLIGLFQIRRFVEPRIGGKGTPILLVHGFCNDAGVWCYFRKKLAKAHSGPIYAISLHQPFHSIEEHAVTLKKRVDAILQETGAAKVILIGHSMGGLVSSLYALGHSSAVQAIIAIATPFHGTYMACLARGENGRQMRHQSPFTQRLCKQLEQIEVPIYQIRTLTDEIVVPSASSLLKGPAERQFTIHDVGHAAMLFSPRIVAQVSTWIK